MGQPILGGQVAAPLSNTAIRYAVVMGGGSWSGTESFAYQVAPTGGSFNKLYVHLLAAPGVGKSYTFTLMINGAPTALTCTISDNATDGSDLANSISVVAADTVSIRCTPSGTPDVTSAFYYSEFTPTIAGEQIIMFKGTANNGTFPIMGSRAANTETKSNQPTPAAGTFSKLYVKTSSAVTAGTKTITLRVNASPTALTCSISSGTTGNDIVNSAAVNAGDLLTYSVTSATGGSLPSISMVFTPTIPNEYIHLGGNINSILSGTTYNVLGGCSSGAYNATESNCPTLFPRLLILKKFYACVQWIQTGALSCQVSVRINSGDSGLTVTFTNVPSPYFEQKSDLTHSYTIPNSAIGAIQTIVSGLTVGGSIMNWGFVLSELKKASGSNDSKLLAAGVL